MEMMLDVCLKLFIRFSRRRADIGRNSEEDESSLDEERASDGRTANKPQRHCLATTLETIEGRRVFRVDLLFWKNNNNDLGFINQCRGRWIVLAEIDRLIVHGDVRCITVLMGTLRLRNTDR